MSGLLPDFDTMPVDALIDAIVLVFAVNNNESSTVLKQARLRRIQRWLKRLVARVRGEAYDSYTSRFEQLFNKSQAALTIMDRYEKAHKSFRLDSYNDDPRSDMEQLNAHLLRQVNRAEEARRILSQIRDEDVEAEF